MIKKHEYNDDLFKQLKVKKKMNRSSNKKKLLTFVRLNKYVIDLNNLLCKIASTKISTYIYNKRKLIFLFHLVKIVLNNKTKQKK